MNHTTQYPVHSVCLLAECHVRRWRGQRWHYYSQEGWQTANRSLSHTDIFKESCGHFQWFFWRPKLTILSQEVGPPPVTKTDILTQTMFSSPLPSVVCASAQAEHKHSTVWGRNRKVHPNRRGSWCFILLFVHHFCCTSPSATSCHHSAFHQIQHTQLLDERESY